MNLPSEPSVSPPAIPVRPRPYHDAPPRPERRFWLHPASGLLILAVDWLFFAPEAATFELAVIVTAPLAFLVTAAGVFWIQRSRNGDSFMSAALKALLGGIVAGIPTSIGGTILGTSVLFLSGLSRWNRARNS